MTLLHRGRTGRDFISLMGAPEKDPAHYSTNNSADAVKNDLTRAVTDNNSAGALHLNQRGYNPARHPAHHSTNNSADAVKNDLTRAVTDEQLGRRREK